MADKCDDVNWSDKVSIWARIPSAKSAIARACTAIDKLTECNFIYSTPGACDDALKRLTEAFDFCVELHDRWSDIKTETGNESASETASKSLGPYEDKQFPALAKLIEYVKKNSTQTSSPVASANEASASTGTVPKLSTCKLLFSKELTKVNTSSEFRLWVATFWRFHDASNLKLQSVATQQGYLLQALSAELQEIVEQKLTPSMPLFGPAGCLDILEGEFRTLYLIFNRWVDFFQVVREQGENSEDFLHRLTKLADMADLGAMSQEELTPFRFIGACDDKRLRDKIFDLKRKDATAIRDTVAQYELQQKAEAALRSKAAPLATVQQPSGKGGKRTNNKQRGLPSQLTGWCASCGDTSHTTPNCGIKKKGILCNNCGKPGHLAKVCFSALQGKSKMTQSKAKPQPIRAITGPEAEPQEPWVNRLKLNVLHTNGSFTFRTFPDTGSAATLIAADLARKNNVRSTKPSNTKYVNVSGDPVLTTGTAPITLNTFSRSINTRAIITPAIKNEIIVGREDLKELGVIPKQFPDPIFIISENQYWDMHHSLIQNNPDVLTDNLPKISMDTGCVSMKIHLMPEEKLLSAFPLHVKFPYTGRKKQNGS